MAGSAPAPPDKSQAIVDIVGVDGESRAALLALNNAHAAETSFLTPQAWDGLIDRATMALCVPDAALLIAFDENAGYDNQNFAWFDARLKRFIYVDRIIVSERCQGQGFARRLYDELFVRAAASAQTIIACEINIDPPNPGSVAFHERLGFRSIGEAALPGGKTVRYMQKDLA